MEKDVKNEAKAEPPIPIAEINSNNNELDNGPTEAAFSSVVLDHWEDKIIWDDNRDLEPLIDGRVPVKKMFRNEYLENDSWTKSSIFCI